MTTEELLDKFANTAPNNWPDIFITESQMHELSDLADDRAVVLAMISEYAGYRGGYSCGDHGHEKAWQAALKHRTRVRDVLGYSYP